MKLQTLLDAEKYLFNFIPQDDTFKFPAEFGLERTKHLASLLNNPQEKLKVIHIAGTSGKGSTAQFTQALLKGCGFKTGLHISPHLLDIRERFQINGELIEDQKYLSYLKEIMVFVEKMKNSKWGMPTYFEIVTVLAYYIFNKEKVDYAVIETGLGGSFDATNIVSSKNKVCIITRIGLDHTRILGKTLSNIAWHKARIVQKYNVVFTINQKKTAKSVIANYVAKQHGKQHFVPIISSLKLGPWGEFQKENASLAIAVLLFLSKRDKFVANEELINKTLLTLRIKGRFEVIFTSKNKLILDGAHNPQKMSAFITSLKKIFPNHKFIFILAFKEGKDVLSMMRYITPVAKKIILTQFWVDTTYSKLSLSKKPNEIAILLKKSEFSEFKVVNNSKQALEEGLKEDGIIVATGSLYFISELYRVLHK